MQINNPNPPRLYVAQEVLTYLNVDTAATGGGDQNVITTPVINVEVGDRVTIENDLYVLKGATAGVVKTWLDDAGGTTAQFDTPGINYTNYGSTNPAALGNYAGVSITRTMVCTVAGGIQLTQFINDTVAGDTLKAGSTGIRITIQRQG